MAVYREITCIRCGCSARRSTTAHAGFCIPCANQHGIEALKAGRSVAAAIRRGELSKATDHNCTDCGGPAREYEHRDYLEPLKVEPVCRSCNHKRGVALDRVLRVAPPRKGC